MNRFNILQHRLRNTSLRVIIFNDVYKNIYQKSLELLNSYNELFTSQSTFITSCFYDITYRYYSMDESDRDNLELLINLIC